MKRCSSLTFSQFLDHTVSFRVPTALREFPTMASVQIPEDKRPERTLTQSGSDRVFSKELPPEPTQDHSPAPLRQLTFQMEDIGDEE